MEADIQYIIPSNGQMLRQRAVPRGKGRYVHLLTVTDLKIFVGTVPNAVIITRETDKENLVVFSVNIFATFRTMKSIYTQH